MTTISQHEEQSMPASVFISYNRRNRPLAERLQIDLQRAGLDVWLDLSDIPPGEDFEARIIPAIAERSHLVLLASPEAKASEWVRREVAEAQCRGKTVVPLRLAGKPGTMLPDWEKLNMIEGAAADYWGAVRRLATALEAPKPELRSLRDLLNSQQGTAANAAKKLGGASIETDSGGRPFRKLPVAPSAYGMTWLFCPPNARLRWPESLAVLLNFTSEYPGTRHKESLAHWSTQVDDPWLVMVEGPVNRESNPRRYELRSDQAHDWADAAASGRTVIEAFVRGRRQVGFYFNGLLPLAFEIGLCSTMVTPHRRVYHCNPASASLYDVAFDGWGRTGTESTALTPAT